MHAINLLGQKDAEFMLSEAYAYHMKELKKTVDTAPKADLGISPSMGQTLQLTPYDFHAAVKNGGHEMVRFDIETRLIEVWESMEDFGWTAVDSASGQIIENQLGVFRVNCLDWYVKLIHEQSKSLLTRDSLDRTNYVQEVISTITLTRFISSLSSLLSKSATFWSAHRELWADNGDQLSKIYAGTGALNTSATRSGKKTFAGLLSDATKSVGRSVVYSSHDAMLNLHQSLHQ